jgi:eukaryotic-like serine/threonine-protein kinase
VTQKTSIHPELQDLFARPGTATSGESLPPDILQHVPGRLAFLCATIIVIEVAGLVLALLTGSPLGLATLIPELVVSVAMLVVARGQLVGTSTLLMLGLVYEVFMAASFTIGVPYDLWLVDSTRIWFPGVAIWILIYPIIVPNTTTKVLVASTIAAAIEPVAVLVQVARGTLAMPAATVWIQQGFGLVVTVGLATVISRQLYQIGVKLSEARSAGSYQLKSKLGEGGMGEVWRAEHRMLARPAAVKLILPERIGDDEESRRTALGRFEREAQVTATLRSPHTIELFDFGVARDGTFYYVMELLDGMDMESLVTEHGPQPAARVVYLMLQACTSLQEAHDAGIVHRDIKPANMFVCRYGGDVDFVKVLDFGLVKHRDVRRKDDTVPDTGAAVAETAAQLTQVGRIAGTPAFMAPELALGDEDLDGRIDIYALGCVAYWLLTGCLVFERLSTQEMLIAHVAQEPPEPSTRVEGIDIPRDLENLIMQSLAKEPNDRPDARGLAKGLRALGLAEKWTEERRTKWWSDHDRKKSASPAVVEISKKTTEELRIET